MLPSNNFRTVAVLIGYQYHKPSSKNILGNGSVLPGILIDLYQAYKFAERSSPTEIIVITDIEEDQIWKETVSAMGKNIVDSGILDFITTIRKKGIYYRHINKHWLENILTGVFRNADRVLFYYTGHGKNGYIEIPVPKTHLESNSTENYLTITLKGDTKPTILRVNNQDDDIKTTLVPIHKLETELNNLSEFMNMEDIRKICFQETSPQVEVLFIFDSCNSTGLGLPFKLRPDGVFRLTDTVPRDVLSFSPKRLYEDKRVKNDLQLTQRLEPISPTIKTSFPKRGFIDNALIKPEMIDNKRNFFRSKAICISSTAPRQDSLSTTDGSVFTRYLFESFSKDLKSLLEIKKNIDRGCSSYAQTATIYSSYPDLRFLWKWLYGGEQKYRVDIDIHQGLVILTPRY